jgi:hypothetical protein
MGFSRLFFFSSCCLIYATSAGQTVGEVALPAAPVRCHIDRAGDVYLVFENGKIEKRNKQGAPVAFVAPQPPFASFDPANGQRLLGFERNQKQITWFYPDLSVYRTHVLDPAVAIEPVWACTSGERDFWIADAADQSMKKVRASDQRVLHEFTLPPSVSPMAQWADLREYQGFVFVVDPQQGVFILNSLGRLIRIIKKSNLRQARFLGEEFFVCENNQLEFFNLFTAQTRVEPLPGGADMVVLSDERMFLIRRTALKILDYKP